MINYKDFESINNIEALIDALIIPEIPDETNFWLIRSESGVFYDEFIDNDFVALSWNSILKVDIDKANSSKDEKDKLYERIKEEYDTERPGSNFNKADRFINGVKDGDIFMIPDKSNAELTFAIAKEYYEEENLSTTEAEFMALKDEGWTEVFRDKECPYFKRRRIEVVTKVSGRHINPNLYRALMSHHGLSDIGAYADDILSSMYPLYFYKDKLNSVFKINAVDKIDALPYSSFIYNSSKLINSSDQISQVTVKSNINSPGSIVLSFLADRVTMFKDSIPILGMIWISLGGGSAFGIEFNSIIKVISNAIDAQVNRERTKAETKSIELDNEMKELEIEMKELEVEKEKRSMRIIENMDKNTLKEIAATSEPLDIDISEFERIIDLKKYKKNKDS